MSLKRKKMQAESTDCYLQLWHVDGVCGKGPTSLWSWPLSKERGEDKYREVQRNNVETREMKEPEILSRG